MQSIEEFIRKHRLTMSAEPVANNPAMNHPDRHASHYRCVLIGPHGEMVVHFTKGSAHTDPAELGEVLDALASDASTIENTDDFEDWARGFGFDEDSRSAERTYRIAKQQTDDLRVFLGEDGFEELLYETERE